MSGQQGEPCDNVIKDNISLHMRIHDRKDEIYTSRCHGDVLSDGSRGEEMIQVFLSNHIQQNRGSLFVQSKRSNCYQAMSPW